MRAAQLIEMVVMVVVVVVMVVTVLCMCMCVCVYMCVLCVLCVGWGPYRCEITVDTGGPAHGVDPVEHEAVPRFLDPEHPLAVDVQLDLGQREYLLRRLEKMTGDRSNWNRNVRKVVNLIAKGAPALAFAHGFFFGKKRIKGRRRQQKQENRMYPDKTKINRHRDGTIVI